MRREVRGATRTSSSSTAFTKVTPEDYDLPLTRKALKGKKQFDRVKFAVTRDAGQKFFVGTTPDFKTARDLASAVAGAKPAIVCAEPEVLRELAIDLATGELVR